MTILKDICQNTVLIADEGKVLSNGETYGKEIYLGLSDRKENWQEIDELPPPSEVEDGKSEEGTDTAPAQEEEGEAGE